MRPFIVYPNVTNLLALMLIYFTFQVFAWFCLWDQRVPMGNRANIQSSFSTPLTCLPSYSFPLFSTYISSAKYMLCIVYLRIFIFHTNIIAGKVLKWKDTISGHFGMTLNGTRATRFALASPILITRIIWKDTSNILRIGWRSFSSQAKSENIFLVPIKTFNNLLLV